MNECFRRAIALFDAANAEDPNHENDSGVAVPKELLYAQRMSAMLARYAPEAPEAVQLAVRAQHIQRWKIPRRDFPMTLPGYKKWRTTLYGFHADLAETLLQKAGCDEATINRVKAAVGKRGLHSNPDTQLMEDVVGLVFLEHYIAAFAALHPEYDEAKWLDIIRKTWRKMSDRAHQFALSGQIRLPEHLAPLIGKAVENASASSPAG
jgi:hypothetical protein